MSCSRTHPIRCAARVNHRSITPVTYPSPVSHIQAIQPPEESPRNSNIGHSNAVIEERRGQASRSSHKRRVSPTTRSYLLAETPAFPFRTPPLVPTPCLSPTSDFDVQPPNVAIRPRPSAVVHSGPSVLAFAAQLRLYQISVIHPCQMLYNQLVGE